MSMKSSLDHACLRPPQSISPASPTRAPCDARPRAPIGTFRSYNLRCVFATPWVFSPFLARTTLLVLLSCKYSFCQLNGWLDTVRFRHLFLQAVETMLVEVGVLVYRNSNPVNRVLSNNWGDFALSCVPFSFLSLRAARCEPRVCSVASKQSHVCYERANGVLDPGAVCVRVRALSPECCGRGDAECAIRLSHTRARNHGRRG